MTPETRQNRPVPDSTRPEAAVDRPKHAPSELPPSSIREKAPPDRVSPQSATTPVNPPARDDGKKKEQAPRDRVVPQSENVPVNPPPPARDNAKKKDKNEPVMSPTP
jgi:hypothetical protein